MNKIFILAGIAIISSSFLLAGEKPPTTNKFVKVEATVQQKQLHSGATGQLLFSVKPGKGIHVNIQPPLSVTLDDDSGATLSGTMIFSTIKRDTLELLDSSKPIKQSFTLTKQMKPGKIFLKGSFVYFYCSDAEGWCSRFKQPFNVEVTVTP